MALLPPSIEPQQGARGLIPHRFRYTMRGTPGALAFPPLCANCGQASAGTIDCRKVFRRTVDDEPDDFVVVSVAVPFCAGCIARHQGATAAVSPLQRLASWFVDAEVFGAIFPGLAAAFFVWLMLKDLGNGRFIRGLSMILFVVIFAAIAEHMRRRVANSTARFRVPPQTEVSRAFDFSDDIAPAFEPARFACSVHEPRFAEAFELLNHGREYIEQSPQARAERRAAQRKSTVTTVVVVAVIVVLLLIGWITDR